MAAGKLFKYYYMEEAKEFSGELMEEGFKKPQAKPTLTEMRFAAMVSGGTDPVHAARHITSSGKNSMYPERSQKHTAANLLKKCQEKMLLDFSKMAPKATKKLEELLDAKDEVYFKGEVVGMRENRSVQLKAAQAIVDHVKPEKKKQGGVSLVGAVIKFIE
jgi:hypothetical protein